MISRKKRSTRKATQPRNGAIVPLAAVMLLVLLVAGGIAVDYARLRLASLELRAAADNVARSCSNELLRTDSQIAAIAKAQQIAARYTVGNQPFSIKSSDVQFGRFGNGVFQANVFPPNSVRINTNRTTGSTSGPINMIFGSMFGVENAELSRYATVSFRMVDVCFVLDRSSSMKLSVASNATGLSLTDPRAALPPFFDSRWRALDNAFDLFVNEMSSSNSQGRIGMVSFASDFTAFGVTSPATRTDLDLTSNFALAKFQMTIMSNSLWNGNTYIEAGMRNGISVLKSSLNARSNAEKMMIVLTDGYQNEGDARLAAADAAANNITIHTITFGDFSDQALMAEIASMGAGRYAHADDAATLQQIMLELAVSLTTVVE